MNQIIQASGQTIPAVETEEILIAIDYACYPKKY
jgi:hypothetical protein